MGCGVGTSEATVCSATLIWSRGFRRTTRHPGYAASQRLRKCIEEGFGWIKTTGGLAKTRHRGLDRVGWMFSLTAAAYNLVRLPKLLAEAPVVSSGASVRIC